jgi:hypothetical protein
MKRITVQKAQKETMKNNLSKNNFNTIESLDSEISGEDRKPHFLESINNDCSIQIFSSNPQPRLKHNLI